MKYTDLYMCAYDALSWNKTTAANHESKLRILVNEGYVNNLSGGLYSRETQCQSNQAPK